MFIRSSGCQSKVRLQLFHYLGSSKILTLAQRMFMVMTKGRTPRTSSTKEWNQFEDQKRMTSDETSGEKGTVTLVQNLCL